MAAIREKKKRSFETLETRRVFASLVGDSNCDGAFDSGDLIHVFQKGEYEDEIRANSTFEDGDWNGDGDFNSTDLIYAFQSGNYGRPTDHVQFHEFHGNPQIPDDAFGLVADDNVFWDPGEIIEVIFLDGSASQREQVIRHAEVWEDFANIDFVFGQTNDPEIAITFAQGGNWSKLGTQSQSAAEDGNPSMSLESVRDGKTEAEIRRVVLHEFGHALGLKHEHLRPDSGIPWDKEAVYNELMGPPNNWDKATIDHNVFDTLDLSSFNRTAYDPLSIMHYSIPNHWTVGDFTTPNNTLLSHNDKRLVGDIYPFADPMSAGNRFVADVNGDGKDDVIGFGGAGTYVSISTGDDLMEPELVLRHFGSHRSVGGWRSDDYPRTMADVNGDGMADIVGFGHDGVAVSLSQGNGFTKPEIWVNAYGLGTGGWDGVHYIRHLADVNGDGKDDIVGFGHDGVSVSLSMGTDFADPKPWSPHFGLGTGGWTKDKYPRLMADVNGDGRDDIVGFGFHDVVVAISTGTSFVVNGNGIWSHSFAEADGWDLNKHVRTLADVNGDGKDDIIGFGDSGTWVALSNGFSFAGPNRWIAAFGHDTGGWREDL